MSNASEASRAEGGFVKRVLQARVRPGAGEGKLRSPAIQGSRRATGNVLEKLRKTASQTDRSRRPVRRPGDSAEAVVNLNCGIVTARLRQGLDSLFECRAVDGRVVVVTSFEYPDGDLMEFYVIEEEPGTLVVTDFAETVATLAAYRFDIESTPKRRKLFESVLRGHGAHYVRGEIRVPLYCEGELSSGATAR